MNHFLQDPRRTGINTLGAGAGRCRRTIAVLATLSVVAGAVGMLDAGPSGASVIAVGGAVAFISPPPLISPTSIPSNGSVVAFTERTAYTLPRSLPVDVTPSSFPTTYNGLGPLTPSTLAASTPVDSYFMVAPVGPLPYVGTVTFSTPILGVIIETSTLRATNSIVGAPGTTYEDFPSQGLKGDDFVELVGPSTIHLDLRSSEFVDEVRVITAVSPLTVRADTGKVPPLATPRSPPMEASSISDPVLRIDGRPAAQPTNGRRRPGHRSTRLLDRRQGRRNLFLRQCRVLRIDGRTAAQFSDCGHGFDARWTRLLAGGL